MNVFTRTNEKLDRVIEQTEVVLDHARKAETSMRRAEVALAETARLLRSPFFRRGFRDGFTAWLRWGRK